MDDRLVIGSGSGEVVTIIFGLSGREKTHVFITLIAGPFVESGCSEPSLR